MLDFIFVLDKPPYQAYLTNLLPKLSVSNSDKALKRQSF